MKVETIAVVTEFELKMNLTRYEAQELRDFFYASSAEPTVVYLLDEALRRMLESSK